MKIIGIIPARMGSSRFPGKPLAKILNRPMLQWVLEGSNYNGFDRLIVATPDDEIKQSMESLGYEVVMTSEKHERASDRTQEAVEIVESTLGYKFDVVVMIQGDEPMINSEMIELAIAPVVSREYRITNLMQTMQFDEWLDPGEVKVVVNDLSEAVYFSREPIPSSKKINGLPNMYKQVCIIPFERDLLDEYSSMNESYLERIESIDMLRLIEKGIPIKMVLTSDITYSVDTPEDLKKVESLL